MRAQIIRSFGEPSVFEAAELPDPTPGPGQALVRLSATSVNPIDWKLRRFGPPSAPELPAVLGCDVAGEVVAVGDGVEHLTVGDKVFGCAGGVRGLGGTYAELIAADARLLARAPTALTLREAAALPLVSITAWEGLDRSGVGPGTRLLVHGGTGGVGHIVVQMAKARGAHVTATVSSPEKATIARDFGADEVVNYREESVDAYVERLTAGRGFDAVFDTTGGSDIGTSFAAARLNGQIVVIVASFTADLMPMHTKGLSLHAVFMPIPLLHDVGRDEHRRIMEGVARLVDAGQLRPLIDSEPFGLDGIAHAHAKLEAGRALGKIVIDI